MIIRNARLELSTISLLLLFWKRRLMWDIFMLNHVLFTTKCDTN